MGTEIVDKTLQKGEVRRDWATIGLVIALNAVLAAAGLLGVHRLSQKPAWVERCALGVGYPAASAASPAPELAGERRPVPGRRPDCLDALPGNPTSAFSPSTLVLFVLGGSLCFFCGLLVCLQRPKRLSALIFQGLTAAMAVSVLTGPGGRSGFPPWLDLGLDTLNALAVSALPVLLLALVETYPGEKAPRWLVGPVWVAGALAVWRVGALALVAADPGRTSPLCAAVVAGRAFLVVGVVSAGWRWRCRRQACPSPLDRRRLGQAALWLGPALAADVILREIPILLGCPWLGALGFPALPPLGPAPLAELIAGLTLAAAVWAAVRFRRWDIGPEFNRDAVSVALFALFLIFYALLLGAVAGWTGPFALPVAFSAATGAAVTAALGFGPFGVRLQEFVDRRFFTRRYQQQQAQERRRQEAEREAELSRLKSFFVAGVSHELKTPLTGIRVFAELLRGRLRRGDGKSREFLSVIDGESARLSRLVENVLDVARIERGEKHYHFQPVDLNASVREALGVMRYPMKMKGTSLRVRLDESAPVVRADPDALVQALLNLLSNALKYSPEPARVRVTTGRRGNAAAVSVADHGIGIAPEELTQVFEPYFRSGDAEVRRRPGAGLGLALVRHIMKAHGGRVAVASRPGKGSRFTLIFSVEEDHGLHSGD